MPVVTTDIIQIVPFPQDSRFIDMTGKVFGRWKEQSVNRRSNRVITFCGQTKCLDEWAEHFGLNPKTVRHRLNLGWPIQQALTQKVHHQSS